MSAIEKQIKPYYETRRFSLFCGDCRSVLPDLETSSVDSIICDPPYELGFMGKGWDRSGIAYDVEVWRECLRVLKPGGHLLAFGGSRTYHRLACAIEDAGFEIRDQIQWIYGSGFPKSLDVSKAIDAAAGVDNVVGEKPDRWTGKGGTPNFATDRPQAVCKVTTPTSEEAKQWNGWGTALKPAHEPIVLARKPLIGTVAENVLAHGTGGLNIDGCRVRADAADDYGRSAANSGGTINAHDGFEGKSFKIAERDGEYASPLGRWPSNLIHDGSDEVLAGFPETQSGAMRPTHTNAPRAVYGQNAAGGYTTMETYGDSGSSARFFYCPKADNGDRNEGLEDLPFRSAGEVTDRKDGSAGLNSPRAGAGRTNGSRNNHPTVKPTDLMRYLCRLVTPLGGIVLDPFCGSGSTGKAAMLEQFHFIGIELSADYCELAQRRIEAVTRQGLLFA